MLDPITILDHVILVIPGPECGTEVHAPFAVLVGGQRLRCLGCDHWFRMGFEGDLLPQFEANFQGIQDQIRQQGFWVEVRPYP